MWELANKRLELMGQAVFKWIQFLFNYFGAKLAGWWDAVRRSFYNKLLPTSDLKQSGATLQYLGETWEEDLGVENVLIWLNLHFGFPAAPGAVLRDGALTILSIMARNTAQNLVRLHVSSTALALESRRPSLSCLVGFAYYHCWYCCTYSLRVCVVPVFVEYSFFIPNGEC